MFYLLLFLVKGTLPWFDLTAVRDPYSFRMIKDIKATFNKNLAAKKHKSNICFAIKNGI